VKQNAETNRTQAILSAELITWITWRWQHSDVIHGWNAGRVSLNTFKNKLKTFLFDADAH